MTHKSIRAHYWMMVLGIVGGVTLCVVVAVQIRLARIDMSDPSTWPNTGPQMAYFAIPEFVALATIPSLLVNWLFDLAKVKRVGRRKYWFALGVAYSLFSASYPLAVGGVNGGVSLLLGGIVAIATAWAIRRRWGEVTYAAA